MPSNSLFSQSFLLLLCTFFWWRGQSYSVPIFPRRGSKIKLVVTYSVYLHVEQDHDNILNRMRENWIFVVVLHVHAIYPTSWDRVTYGIDKWLWRFWTHFYLWERLGSCLIWCVMGKGKKLKRTMWSQGKKNEPSILKSNIDWLLFFLKRRMTRDVVPAWPTTCDRTNNIVNKSRCEFKPHE